MTQTKDNTAQAPPLCPELMERQLDAECAFNAALAEFQATVRPVTSLELAAVVEAARPAFAAGFCFTVRDAGDAMEVSLRHKDGGEEVSASNDHRFPGALLAGLLGIPVCSDGQASEPEPVAAPVAAPAEPTPEPIAAVTSEAADEPDLMGPDSPADIPGDHPSLVPLTAQQTESALLMIKQMEPAARKAFQIAFRNAFDLDRNVTRIAPHITQLRHLEFIDRFTVEAAGGVAA